MDDERFPLDVTAVGDIIGTVPLVDDEDNPYDDARRVLRSDWLAARDRENRAIGWDERDALTALERENPDRRQPTNPYRRDDR